MAEIAWEEVDDEPQWEEVDTPEPGPVEGITGPAGFTGEAPPRAIEPAVEMSVPESVMIGAEQGIPFAPQIASGIETAVDVARHPSADILETYQANRNNRLARARESSKTNPWAHGIASAGAGLGTALAAAPYTALGAAGVGVRALANAVADTGLAAAQRMNEGENPGSYEPIRDMLFGRAIGKGISGVIGAVANPTKTIGQAIEAGHDAYDSGMGILGRIGKYIGLRETGDEIADAAKSSKVIALEQKIKDAETFQPSAMEEFAPEKLNLSHADATEHAKGTSLPYRLAQASREGRAELYDDGVSFDPNELGYDFAQMFDDSLKAGQRGHYPSNWELGNMRDSVRSARREAEAARDSIIRNDKIASENLKETAVSGVSKKTGAPPQESAQAIDADRSAKERDALYQALFEKENAVADSVDRYKGMSEDTMTAFKQSRGDTVARAKTLLEQMNEAERVSARNASGQAEVDATNRLRQTSDAAEKARFDAEAKKATGQLGDIRTGRAMVDMGTPFNLAKAVMGAPGKGTGNIIQKVIDFGGAQGQRMAQAASRAEQWATRDDNLGRMARWALSGDAETAVVRMAILADMPEAQDETGIEQ